MLMALSPIFGGPLASLHIFTHQGAPATYERLKIQHENLRERKIFKEERVKFAWVL